LGVTIQAGTYTLGPETGAMSVRTRRTGAAAMAGHNLLFEVTSWKAELVIGEEPAGTSLALEVDGASLRVLEGTGGVQSLGDDDKAEIEQTIDKDVLKRQEITFHSTSAAPAGEGVHVEGDLTLLGQTRPLAFDVAFGGDGAITAVAVVKQTAWGIKPYSTLYGALKVVDEVEVRLAATMPTQSE
jgi:polyisoprenoid-binding protein YceI